MKNFTRTAFNMVCQHLAKINGAAAGSHAFNVQPTIQQNIEKAIQESSAFLSAILSIIVDELEGEKIQVNSRGPLASRTHTKDGTPRKPVVPHELLANRYLLHKTNFDTFIDYETLDVWAKFPNFMELVRQVAIVQQALDRIMIGWHGTKAAANTDIATNTLLEDVNVGWLAHIRTKAEAQVKDEGNTIGESGADYKNLDALVFDVYHTYIKPMYRNGTEIVAIVGESILLDKYFPLINENQPTEKIAADMIISQKRIGNLQAVQVPYFPEKSILLTPLNNLAIYSQNGKRRMAIKDKPELDRIEFFESSNEGYVVQDYNRVALIENIEIKEE